MTNACFGSSTPSPPTYVDNEEQLARSIFSRKHVKRQLNKVLLKAFEPPRKSRDSEERIQDISVDRCGYLEVGKAVQLGDDKASGRGTGANFYGWALIRARVARGPGRDVISTPSKIEQNPAHADIRLPQSTTTDAVERNDHLLALAENSTWCSRPD